MLNNHTYYSYTYGTISPEDLLQLAKENGYQHVVLTDINSTSASLDFIRLAPKYDVKPIVGIDFRNGAKQQYIGLARNNEGFKELNMHLSFHLHTSKPFEEDAPTFSNAYVIYPMSKKYRKLDANEYVGIRPSELLKLQFSPWKYSNKLVILHPVTFTNKRTYNAHRLLRAIDVNVLLSQLPKTEEAYADEMMVPMRTLEKYYEQYPQIVLNTKSILVDCAIEFDFTTSKNKKVYSNSVSEDYYLLETECKKGLKYRYSSPSSTVYERLDKELEMIKKLNFSAYFLINWDLVTYARSQNFYYVGRGSGANSIVAYLLRITDVDPIELDLYFERFINPSRSSPPDFDIDFSSRDRNQVTQYLFEKYGPNHTALVGNYITFQYKSVIRELGKVLGLPAEEIKKVQQDKSRVELDDVGKLIIRYGELISGLPSHMSVHSSGIVISDENIYNYTATNMPPKGFPTTHFSMLEAEDIGLAKFDILGQRGLGKIKDSVAIIKQNRGVDVDVHQIEKLKNDPKVKELIKTGDAVGCSYVESPAMRNLLQKLQADNYVTLVAASSIIRPGVAQSGMMREYILRYQNPERRQKAKDALPELYKILHDTYGIMVYQEDVIKVAHLFAGLTLTEADVLRRGMSGKYRSRDEFMAVKETFFSNCKSYNYSDAITHEIWRQIESFAGYAFPKGHSASYAVESFQALYLKAYYPIEYMVATVNNGGGFFSREVYLHEAKLHGADVQPPCVNTSESYTVVEGKTIWMGLHFVNGLEDTVIQQVVKERVQNGVYQSFEDFLNRVPISLDQLRLLVRVNGFDFTGEPKTKLLWKAHLALGSDKKNKPKATLFPVERKQYHIPEFQQSDLEKAYDHIELLNFPLQFSHFELVAEFPATKLVAADLPRYLGKHVEIVANLVHRKRTKTHGGQEMSFGTFLDLNGKWLDTVQFPIVNRMFPFRGYGCYLIKGRVIDELGVLSIETISLERLKQLNVEEDNPRMTRGVGNVAM